MPSVSQLYSANEKDQKWEKDETKKKRLKEEICKLWSRIRSLSGADPKF